MISFKDKIRCEIKDIVHVDRLNFDKCADGYTSEIDIQNVFHQNMYSYKIGFYYVQSGQVYEDNISDIKENFYNTLKREVYGSIQEKVLKLERAFIHRDKESMEQSIMEIKKEVF